MLPVMKHAQSQTIEEEEESKATMASSSTTPKDGAELIQNGINFFDLLPEECIAIITSFTTPMDACRLALVSKTMLSASESDVVWNRFLPSDIDLIVSRSDEQEALLIESQSKKQLYKRLTDQPLLVDQSSKNFWLEISSGKKCWMIGARSVSITWGDTDEYWRWSPIPKSWFPEAAELLCVWWFDIGTTIQTSMLSPSTQYEAYLVFSMTGNAHGFEQPFKATVSIAGGGKTVTDAVYLDVQPRRGRAEGWWEVMIGEFYSNDPGEEGDEVELSVREVERLDYKSGIIIDGIELRPASGA